MVDLAACFHQTWQTKINYASKIRDSKDNLEPMEDILATKKADIVANLGSVMVLTVSVYQTGILNQEEETTELEVKQEEKTTDLGAILENTTAAMEPNLDRTEVFLATEKSPAIITMVTNLETNLETVVYLTASLHQTRETVVHHR